MPPRDPANLLGSIKGIIQARVAWGDGGPQHVEVIAGGERPAAQVARDVRSVLAVQYGAEVSPEQVRVIRVGGQGAPSAPYAVQSVSVARTAEGTAVRVRVQVGGATGEAEAWSPAGTRGEARLAAEAALLAVGRAIGFEMFGLVDLQAAQVAGRKVFIAAVEGWHAEERRLHFGLAPLRGSPAEAAARAVLQAVQDGCWS